MLVETIYLLSTIVVVYVLEKLFWRPKCKDRWKRFSISYYIDKYIFLRKESNTWASYDD